MPAYANAIERYHEENRTDGLSMIVAELDDAAVLTLHDEAERRAAHILRENAINKLAAFMAADIKGDGPAPLPSTQQQVRELLGELGQQLTQAAQSLSWAAERLKQQGDGYGASQVHAAALRVKAAAQGVR